VLSLTCTLVLPLLLLLLLQLLFLLLLLLLQTCSLPHTYCLSNWQRESQRATHPETHSMSNIVKKGHRPAAAAAAAYDFSTSHLCNMVSYICLKQHKTQYLGEISACDLQAILTLTLHIMYTRHAEYLKYGQHQAWPLLQQVRSSVQAKP
jgi:hypothetical protein